MAAAAYIKGGEPLEPEDEELNSKVQQGGRSFFSHLDI